ncbi:NAD-dependent succinate-semialdehyde dehydrogenase [Shewanella waksmanii]|uniref:NAD-dependent succinate-semialdehyde dehydrogenase n=1 Tax=Shewanella waksmanii TaxID=213783 RepID=UPI003735B010
MLGLTNQSLLQTSSYIDGRWTSAPQTFAVINPATGMPLAEVGDCSVTQVEAAVNAAFKAKVCWRQMTAQARAKILMRWHQLMLDNQDDLARLLTLEQGKPLSEAMGEIRYGAAYIEWFAEEGKRLYGDTIMPPSADKRIIVTKQPVGVVTAITPWNFPNAMIARKAAAALAAGCTFVVKPSPLTPLSALALAELAHQAGIPAGVFNVVVTNDAQGAGEILTQHAAVAKFTFTGSTRVGKLLAGQCAQGVKRVSLELGGNAPFIVFDDADIEAALDGLMAVKFRNAGQTCVSANRIYLHRDIAQQFTQGLIERVNDLVIGDGIDAETQIGPVISSQAKQQMLQWVQQSIAMGANLVAGEVDEQHKDLLVTPCVLTDVTALMPVMCNEVFGPIAAISVFDNEQDVIALANDTEYGLAAYFYSRDIGRVHRVAEALDFGMVGINDGAISNAAAPFGGIKQSGHGREGSKYGLDDYVDIKYLSLGGLSI